MGKLSRMAVANMKAVLGDAGLENTDAIITATGLGSLDDTERFLQKFIPAGDSLVPPVSFIQSGHNTVAGQLALYLGNGGYNMTHVQGNVSFENALLDAFTRVNEAGETVLLGAFDEKIPLLDELADDFGLDENLKSKLSEGATFMIAGPRRKGALAKISDVEISMFHDDPDSVIHEFLKRNKIDIADTDAVLTGHTLSSRAFSSLSVKTMVYTDFCGHYFTSSAFGCHLAADLISQSGKKRVLLVNYMPERMGLMLLENV